MLNKITYDNVVKGLIAISLLFMAFGAKAADFSGSVGVSSDNYFRGVNISDGAGYSVKGLVDLDNGIFDICLSEIFVLLFFVNYNFHNLGNTFL